MLWTEFINSPNNNNTLDAIKIIRINEKQKISQQRWYSPGQHAGSRSVEQLCRWQHRPSQKGVEHVSHPNHCNIQPPSVFSAAIQTHYKGCSVRYSPLYLLYSWSHLLAFDRSTRSPPLKPKPSHVAASHPFILLCTSSTSSALTASDFQLRIRFPYGT